MMKQSILYIILIHCFSAAASALPAGFVDVGAKDPSLFVEMRYFSKWNFMGRKVSGYEGNKCILSEEAAAAIIATQKELQQNGLSLLLLDCYRPQKAVDEFYLWSQNKNDLKMKAIFYPMELKDQLFDKGYIARNSGHSRGSTVDLTLVDLSLINKSRARKLKFQEEAKDCRLQDKIELTAQLDMGTTFDCMDPKAATNFSPLSMKAQKNRKLLVDAMEKNGFINYSQEWWHFRLKNEPFPSQYFDFPVQ
jgi:zinc D-Ala-D-Ala dipeptidase